MISRALFQPAAWNDIYRLAQAPLEPDFDYGRYPLEKRKVTSKDLRPGRRLRVAPKHRTHKAVKHGSLPFFSSALPNSLGSVLWIQKEKQKDGKRVAEQMETDGW